MTGSGAGFNAAKLDANLDLVQDDILHIDSTLMLEGKWDMIVSNPPYIVQQEIHKMDPSVLQYEPYEALFAPNNNPVEIYVAIAQYGAHHLNPGGYLIMEMNEFTATEISEALQKMSFSDMQILEDMQGKQRILKLKK